MNEKPNNAGNDRTCKTVGCTEKASVEPYYDGLSGVLCKKCYAALLENIKRQDMCDHVYGGNDLHCPKCGKAYIDIFHDFWKATRVRIPVLENDHET